MTGARTKADTEHCGGCGGLPGGRLGAGALAGRSRGCLATRLKMSAAVRSGGLQHRPKKSRLQSEASEELPKVFKYRNYRIGLGFEEDSGGGVEERNKAAAAAATTALHQVGLGDGAMVVGPCWADGSCCDDFLWALCPLTPGSLRWTAVLANAAS